jgi:predicted glutamine amidotransferase
MCIAILNNSGILPKSVFKTAWKNNPDGGGIAWYDKKIHVFKEMKDYKLLQLLKYY